MDTHEEFYMTSDIRSVVSEAVAQANGKAQTDTTTEVAETTLDSANQVDTAQPKTDGSGGTLKVSDSQPEGLEKYVKRNDLPEELRSHYDQLNKTYLKRMSEKTTKYSSELKSREMAISEKDRLIAELQSQLEGLNGQSRNYDSRSNKSHGNGFDKQDVTQLTPEQLDDYLSKREESKWVEGQEKLVIQKYPELFNEDHPSFNVSTTIKVKAGVEALQNDYYTENKTLNGFDYLEAVNEVLDELEKDFQTRAKEYHEQQLAELRKSKKAAQQMNPGGNVIPTLPSKGSSIRDIVQAAVDASKD